MDNSLDQKMNDELLSKIKTVAPSPVPVHDDFKFRVTDIDRNSDLVAENRHQTLLSERKSHGPKSKKSFGNKSRSMKDSISVSEYVSKN